MNRQRFPLAIGFGAWAAAVAVAPGMAAKAVLAAPVGLTPLAWWTVARPGRWLPLFFAAALLTPPLPIALGDSGPHASLLFAALGIFAGALWMNRWGAPDRAREGAVSYALLALLGAMLASVAFAAIYSGVEAAAGSLARVALFGISVYVFFYTVRGPGEPFAGIRLVYWIAVAAALFACIDFYFQLPAPAGYGPQFVWLDSGVYRRAQGLFYEASTLGNFCAFFLVMIAVALTRPRAQSPVSRAGLVAGGAVFFAALVLSYSRASLVAVLVALGVLAWSNRQRIRLGKILLGLPVCAAVVWKIFPAFAEIYWLRISATAEYLFSATAGVLSGRVASWSALTLWISAHPWSALLGIGYKTLPYSGYVGAAIVADNMYLSLLIETGIAGLAALVWLNVAVLRAAARASRSVNPRASFLGAWMLCFWAGEIVQMFSGDLLTYWRVLPVYFWALGLAVRS